MKIILCYPPKRIYQGYGQDTRWLPLGIASIGAYINKVYPDLDIVLLDCFNMTPEVAYNEIQKEVPKNETVIIGFTLFTEQRFSVINLCQALKNNIKDANIITVVGGPHAFIMAEQLVKNYPFIDHIIKGEGEEAFNTVVKYYLNTQPVPIPKKIEAENIQDLSTLPHSIDGFKLFKNLPEMTEAPIVFSRGCTDMCTFCSTTKFWKGYRSRKATDVFNEMLKYFTDYNITYFKFHDDACTANIEELKSLCRMIIYFEYNKVWMFELTARADQFDDELIELLKQAGCKKVALGIESGNRALRKSMNKRLNMDVAKENMKNIMAAGIEVAMLLIIGYPGETDDTIKDTVNLIREVNPTMTCKQPLMIFPGTKVYDDLKKEGWIDDDYWLGDQAQPYYTKEANWDKLNVWIKKVNAASRKLNILLAVPARQTEEKFKLHVETLNRLIVPEYVNLQRLFVLHNSDELKKYLSPGDNMHIIHTDEEYIVDENTHHWKDNNLRMITYIKNEIVQAVINGGFDYVFFVDSDLLLQPETLLCLLESGKDIIAEIFWTDWLKSGKEEPNAWEFDHYRFFQGTMEQWKKPGTYKCGGTGACILVHRSVYEKGVNYNPIPNVSFWGEDRSFSIRAYVANFEMWVDTRYPCEHMYREIDVEKVKKFLRPSEENSNKNTDVNSVEWWNEEFKYNWEVGIDGKRQTEHFAEITIENLPYNIIDSIRDTNNTILDWGCALGQGTNVFSKLNPNVVGLDTSTIAIQKARELFPGLTFRDDELKLDDSYDIIYTSNCLEHFRNPYDVMAFHMIVASKMYIALVPYEQRVAGSHFYNFTENDFPEQLNGFRLIYRLVIQPERETGSICSCIQLLVVYKR